MSVGKREVRAPRGTELSCKGWQQEAALRMLMNNLDPDVGEKPDELIVYGGIGKAARNWQAFDDIVAALKTLEDDETLLVQSGKPVGVFLTHRQAPRVLISNSMLVPNWADWENFRQLEKLGLMMYGQMTAGSWIYIGSQGILQGTYETFAAAARQHFDGDLRGRWILSAGLGGMGGAQPLAATMNGAVFLGIEVDPQRIEKRLRSGYCDEVVDDLTTAMSRVKKYLDSGQARSIALLGNAADLVPAIAASDFIPDICTDQTSAHDELNGYVPNGMTFEEATRCRQQDPDAYIKESYRAMAEHMRGILKLQERGVVAFDYGNNLRGQAQTAGVDGAFDVPGFVPKYIRPLFCEGKGPFRWAALSGDPEDILTTDRALMELFPEDQALTRWLQLAQERIAFQGLPARICWLGYRERDVAGLRFNQLVREGKIKAPIVIGRDHLDAGSVASPNRETEGMKDGSDAVADWPILNALLNTACGATWVSVHHGGGVGMGLAIHAGMVVVADGSEEADESLRRVLVCDPGTGVMRHADAGYSRAVDVADQRKLKLPGINYP